MAAVTDGVFPDEVLLDIFSYLSIEEESQARRVCNQWNDVIKVDIRWKKLLKKWTAKEFEHDECGTRAYKRIVEIWNASTPIGKERWLYNPLGEIYDSYECHLREAEFEAKGGISSMNLYLRLNPCYEFTTRGKEVADEEMKKHCSILWENFGSEFQNDRAHDIKTCGDAMAHAKYMSKQQVMSKVLNIYEPEWLLEGLLVESYTLDEDGNIVGTPKHLPPPEDEDDEDSPRWTSIISERFPPELYNKLKAVFADDSKHFIRYFMSEGCVNENYQYGHFLYVSDTAAIYLTQYYDL